MTARTTPRLMARLYWLALGTFAIGTEGFMIAPLLPDLARDLSVSLASAGQRGYNHRQEVRYAATTGERKSRPIVLCAVRRGRAL